MQQPRKVNLTKIKLASIMRCLFLQNISSQICSYLKRMMGDKWRWKKSLKMTNVVYSVS